MDGTHRQVLWNSAGRQQLDKALRIILDTRNHPILLHDDSGKSTVSLLCGLIRRMQCWSLMGVYAEADLFAGPAGGAEGSGVGEAGREVRQSCIQGRRADQGVYRHVRS